MAKSCRSWWRGIALGAGCLIAAGAMAAAPAAGKLEKITVHGASLAGNLSGDSADRTVFVYLPPGYDTERARRYPTVYFLHGFGATAQMYVDFLAAPVSIDRAIAAGRLPPAIIVLPDALNRYGSSMYSNSPVIGDWEAFIARDLVAHIDGRYRTIARREARGLAGHSMGGYGTLRIGMKHPDTFAALYAMSSCCLDPRGAGGGDAALEALQTPEDVEKIPVLQRTTLSSAASWAPNPQRPPFYMDLPTKDGQPQADVLARFSANALTVMAYQHVPQLKRHKAIKLDIGLQDFLIRGNVEMVRVLTQLGVQHEYVNYEGDHMNKVAERFEQHVLPFFAQHLESGGRR